MVHHVGRDEAGATAGICGLHEGVPKPGAKDDDAVRVEVVGLGGGRGLRVGRERVLLVGLVGEEQLLVFGVELCGEERELVVRRVDDVVVDEGAHLAVAERGVGVGAVYRVLFTDSEEDACVSGFSIQN